MVPVSYRVTKKERETGATVTLELAPEDDPIAAVTPGQFNMLWAFGVGEVPISVSAIKQDGVLVHTIRDVGGVTRVLCAKEPGETVGVRGPFGRGWDLGAVQGRDLVIVAGGIGLAPLRPVVHAVLSDPSAFEDIALVVGARTSDELLFRSELDSWWHGHDIMVRTIVDRPSPDWSGNVGVVTKELPRVPLLGDQTVAMVCGPEVMMRFSAMSLIDRGVTPDRIFVSLERNMQCAIEHCGHCQLAGLFVCTDGPVVTFEKARPLMEVREL